MEKETNHGRVEKKESRHQWFYGDATTLCELKTCLKTCNCMVPSGKKVWAGALEKGHVSNKSGMQSHEGRFTKTRTVQVLGRKGGGVPTTRASLPWPQSWHSRLEKGRLPFVLYIYAISYTEREQD